MKSKIKNYAAFLPQSKIIKWLIVMYPFLLLPSFLSCTKLDEFSAQICFLGNMAGIPFVEIFFQMFLFRGVLEKERLSYFKSSAEGIDILKNSLFMDTVRRFSYLGFLMIVAIFLYSTDLFVKTRYHLSVFAIINIFLWTFFCSEIGVLCTQWTTILVILFSILFVITIPVLVLCSSGWHSILICFIFLGFHLILFYNKTRWYSKKIKESYYPNENEKE